MIELSSMHIDQYNGIIEARKKIYCLVKDLHFHMNIATHIATLVSELLREVLSERKSTDLKLAFTKAQGYYHLHLFIAAEEAIYRLLKKKDFFSDLSFCLLENQPPQIELRVKILDPLFIPKEAFLQTERERLIQHSSGEMLQEIRKKNTELNKALHDLKASSEMIQSEKMRALGSMTAGVAHELNNPMMGILNFIQYAIKHTDTEDRRYRPLTDALREVNRCQEIITNLLTFSRMKAEGEEEFSALKLSTLFERILQLQRYQLHSHDIKVFKTFPKNESECKMKVHKMQQVILNLVTNAIDAMKQSEKRELIINVAVDNTNTIIRVTDTGAGIDEETLDKIFEPFFTTKQTGEGTGLGLAVSKSIIEEHNGSLHCHSIVGEGTCFTVKLPIINT